MNILHTLKKRDLNNTTKIKTIYNARHKYSVAEMAGRSQMKQLKMNLEANKYIECHTSNDATDCVSNIFWAHPSSVELLQAFPEVLIMDSTYKINRYRLPLLEIVDITSTQLTFSVAFVYLESKNEQTYTWALERLKSLMDGCMLPRVIVTDKEMALTNASNNIFPNAINLLCRWHISMNILANCKKLFETKDRWDGFITSWNMLIISPTEDDYMQFLSACNRNFCRYPQALDYVKKSWLSKHKEQFVAAWTDVHMHFGNVTTNKVESAHAKLKRHLGSSTCNFNSGWMAIHALLELHFREIKASFEKNLNTVQHKFRPALFRELRRFISQNALDIVLNESMRADYIGTDSAACGCVIRMTRGLPCAHEIVEYRLLGSPIPLTCIHHHWRKLDLTPTVVVETPELTTTTEFELIVKKFQNSDQMSKIQILKQLKEVANPSSTYLLELDVKLNNRGRSTSKNKKPDTSTRRDPSAFEYALPIQEIATPNISNTVMTKKNEKLGVRRIQSRLSTSYVDSLPQTLIPFIQHIKDVTADGNCGFRCVAGLLGMGEENWDQVRIDLSNELQKYHEYYTLVYRREHRVGEIYYILSYLDSNPSFDRWMSILDMGYLIASFYNVVLIHISLHQCLTFLPLRSPPIQVPSRKVFTIGFVNGNHFVQTFFASGSPMPPIATNWHKYHLSCATGWELPYATNIEQFKDIIGDSVAT